MSKKIVSNNNKFKHLWDSIQIAYKMQMFNIYYWTGFHLFSCDSRNGADRNRKNAGDLPDTHSRGFKLLCFKSDVLGYLLRASAITVFLNFLKHNAINKYVRSVKQVLFEVYAILICHLVQLGQSRRIVQIIFLVYGYCSDEYNSQPSTSQCVFTVGF